VAPANGTEGSTDGVRPLSDWLEGLVAVGFLVLLALAALTVLAFSRATHVATASSIGYRQSGTLSYGANATAGPAYPNGQVVTGDPLFLRLVDSVDFRFAYRFASSAPHHIAGSSSLDAVLSSSTGWKRTINLEPPTPFAGDRTVLHGSLNTRTLPALVAKVEKATQVTGNYTLTVAPHVSVHGRLGGHPLNTTFVGPLAFSYSADELQPQIASGQSANPLRPKTAASITFTRPTPAYISFKVAKMPVETARTVVLPAIAATVLALLACSVLVRRGRPADETEGIRSRYRDWLIPVTRVRPPTDHQVVEVTDMDALGAIAERYDRMILHEESDAADTFSVADEGVLYRYVVPREPPPPDNVTPLTRKSA
jgi:signal peptidase